MLLLLLIRSNVFPVRVFDERRGKVWGHTLGNKLCRPQHGHLLGLALVHLRARGDRDAGYVDVLVVYTADCLTNLSLLAPIYLFLIDVVIKGLDSKYLCLELLFVRLCALQKG